MANFAYKKQTKTTMKVKGILSTEDGVIVVDDVERTISSLLSDFDGQEITFVITNQLDEDLPEPID